MGRDLANDPQLGSFRSAIEAAMNDDHLTDAARGLLTVGASIRRKWQIKPEDFKTIRELTAYLQLPLNAERNRLIGAFFTHQPPPSTVNTVTKDGRATCYKVGPFVPWLRKMCAWLDVLSTVRTTVDNIPLNEAIYDLMIRNRL